MVFYHAHKCTLVPQTHTYTHSRGLTDDTETQTGAITHTCTCTNREAGRVIQLKKVKADVFPKNDGL